MCLYQPYLPRCTSNLSSGPVLRNAVYDRTSVAVLAEISLRSPRNLCFFSYRKMFLLYQSTQKIKSKPFWKKTSPGRTSNYWIALGERTSAYRGTQGSKRSGLGPIEFLKEWLSFCWLYLSSLVFVDLMGSTQCEIKIKLLRCVNSEIQ